MRAVHLVLAVAVAALALQAAVAWAQPQLPATFYGSVTIDGAPAPTGTEVRAFIGAVDCTQAAPGERPVFRDGEAAAYVVTVLHESQRPGCGRPGATVTFTIDGQPALQSASWQPGPARVDLSLGSPTVIPLPTSTPTPRSSPTPTPRATPTGPPPTDDVTLPGTIAPGDANPGGSAAGDRPGAPGEADDASGTPWIATGIATLLITAAAAAAIVLRRRARQP